jgi:isopenicillin-N N-acyltransferase-like protein
MNGIAEGAAVDMHELFVYQGFDEFFAHLIQSGTLDPSIVGHGTTAAVRGGADHPNLVGHNNDVPSYHEELVSVLHIKEEGSDQEILQGTFAGQIAQNGVNNRGLGVGINTLMDLPAGDGLPASFHVRRLLGCGDLDEAISYLQSANFSQATNYTIADRSRVACVETHQRNAVVLDIFDGDFAIHTSHSLQPDAPSTSVITAKSQGASPALTLERLELAQKLIWNVDTMALRGFQQLFRTRPILVHPGKPTGRTLMNTIAEIPAGANPTLHVTPGSPNLDEHVPFGF